MPRHLAPLETVCFDILADSDLEHLGMGYEELEPAERSIYLSDQAQLCAPKLRAIIEAMIPQLEPVDEWKHRNGRA